MTHTEKMPGEEGLDIERLGSEAGEIALIATKKLKTALKNLDTKTAKDLSGIIKDMAALYRDLNGDTGREITVTFSSEAEECAG